MTQFAAFFIPTVVICTGTTLLIFNSNSNIVKYY